MSQPIGPAMQLVTARPGGAHGESRGSLIRPGVRYGGDALLSGMCAGSAVTVILMLAALVAVMLLASMPTIREFGWKFLVTSEWRPNSLEVPKTDAQGNVQIVDGETVMQTIPPSFGALPVIYGTAISSIVALVFAIPLSFGAALFLIRI